MGAVDVIADRARGILFGLAAGDRIGGPIRMGLCLARSLESARAFDLVGAGKKYLNWWTGGGFDSGPTAERVFELVARGATFAEAVRRADEETGGMTAGCNPAHRSSPLAMLAAIRDEDLPVHAMAEAALTHRHPLAGDVAAAVVVLCRGLVRGAPWSEARARAASGRSAETRAALAGIARAAIRPGGYAPDVLGAAVHFVDAHGSFAEALRAAVDFAGPANYCPVLAGSVGGARWGRAAIPEELLTHAGEVRSEVEEASEALARTWTAQGRRKAPP